ncbi:MAG: transglutaminase family protein [Novosphingobium sp.]
MKLNIHTQLDYSFTEPTDVVLQLEAAPLDEQQVEAAYIAISPTAAFARVAGHDGIGDRVVLNVESRLTVDYTATVTLNRLAMDYASLPATALHALPGGVLDYLAASRFCPSDLFGTVAESEFAGLAGGARIAAISDWIGHYLTYMAGSSTQYTTAMDTFVARQGVCRDYAHLLITLARASEIPARFSSVYGLGVEPQDFHAVAEVFLGDAWHLVDPTGMADPSGIVRIGAGRDAADVPFLSSFGFATFIGQSVEVWEV